MSHDDDELQPWRRLDSTEHAANPYFSLHQDRVRLPDASEHDYHFVRTPGSVLIVPWARDKRRLLLVRQYRYLMGQVVLEFPGGGIKPSQASLEAAQAELAEETGYVAKHWQPLGWFNPCKGLLVEQCHVFLATGLERATSVVAGDATEEIASSWLSPHEFEAAIRLGQIHDGMTLCAWALAREAILGRAH